MNTSKLTPSGFVERLNAGAYTSVANARRAIGRVAWSKAVSERARLLIEQYFTGKKGITPEQIEEFIGVKTAQGAVEKGDVPAAVASAKEPDPKGFSIYHTNVVAKTIFDIVSTMKTIDPMGIKAESQAIQVAAIESCQRLMEVQEKLSVHLQNELDASLATTKAVAAIETMVEKQVNADMGKKEKALKEANGKPPIEEPARPNMLG